MTAQQALRADALRADAIDPATETRGRPAAIGAGVEEASAPVAAGTTDTPLLPSGPGATPGPPSSSHMPS